MERTRQVFAVIAAVLIIIILVLFARWVGDKLREKFLVAKAPAVNTIPKNDNIVPTSSLIFDNKDKPEPAKTTRNGTLRPIRTATYSAIPSTGPQEVVYFVIALFFLSGVSISFLSRKTI